MTDQQTTDSRILSLIASGFKRLNAREVDHAEWRDNRHRTYTAVRHLLEVSSARNDTDNEPV